MRAKIESKNIAYGKRAAALTKLGVFLIIVSVAYLLVTIFSPDIVVPLGSLFCPTGQKLKSETVTYSRPGETDMNNYYHCVDSDNRELSDVTGPVTIMVMGGFVLLLLVGIILTTVGARGIRTSSQTAKSYVLPLVDPSGPPNRSPRFQVMTSSDPNAVNANLNNIMDGLQHGVIRFGGQEIHVDDLKAGNYPVNLGQGSQRTLTETLRQLEDAHTQSLINDEEYQKLRQEALDKLV